MKAILKAIERNPRLTPAEIAVMTGQTEEEVAAAIARAEADRIILGYRTVINWERAGEDEVAALIEVRCAPQRETGFDAVARRIYRYPEVRSVWLVSGTFDLAVMVVAKSMREVSLFVSERLATIDAVQGTATYFIMKRYKEDGAILDGDEPTAHRLAVTP
ncbi:MAG: Lrp/AsnC family transcriptional regulator [Chloroflexota bacterium]|nr:Lrp/AsnC family transcriptional regulator [Dehalococcoidia bacterium]MDW8254905.1 Lrp/AsnC family transcriptional regulator [Chloroflexota bacterium]